MRNKILRGLLYYSTVLITILIVVGFFVGRSVQEIIINLLFLPVAVYLWAIVIYLFRSNKKTKKLKV